MRKEIIKQDKEYWITNCPYCEQEIKGTSKSQAEYLLLQHKLAKHKDKIEIKEVKK